jgi:hypothetical protein
MSSISNIRNSNAQLLNACTYGRNLSQTCSKVFEMRTPMRAKKIINLFFIFSFLAMTGHAADFRSTVSGEHDQLSKTFVIDLESSLYSVQKIISELTRDFIGSIESFDFCHPNHSNYYVGFSFFLALSKTPIDFDIEIFSINDELPVWSIFEMQAQKTWKQRNPHETTAGNAGFYAHIAQLLKDREITKIVFKTVLPEHASWFHEEKMKQVIEIFNTNGVQIELQFK